MKQKPSEDNNVLNTVLQLQFRPHKEEDQHHYDGDRADDRRNAPRGMHYSSPKENLDIYRPPLAHTKDVEPTAPGSASFQQLYEARSRELGVVEHELRATLEEKQALANAYGTLKQQYDERSKKLNTVRHERQAALAHKREIEDALAALRRQYEEQKKELNVVRHERQAALEQRQKVVEDYATLKQAYEAQGDGYNTLRNKYNSLKATLEQRTSELQGVQRFLTTADRFSGSEVVNTLRKLNEEVQQSTTFMAEWAVENFMFQIPHKATPQTTDRTRMSEALGMRFAQLLGTKSHKENPILVEMAFRAYLIYELYWYASPWSIGEAEQSHNVYIDGIYQRIRAAGESSSICCRAWLTRRTTLLTEGQAISGNWRALTRMHTLPACMSDVELAQTIVTTIISGFSDILVAAGCTASRIDITSALRSKFAEQIHHFVSLAGQVNKIIGVGIISEDFEVLVVSPEAIFDDNAMEDSYDDGDRAQGTEEHTESVLCATELGLMQRMGVGAGTGHDGKPSELIVIKPKVALVSVIDVLNE